MLFKKLKRMVIKARITPSNIILLILVNVLNNGYRGCNIDSLHLAIYKLKDNPSYAYFLQDLHFHSNNPPYSEDIEEAILNLQLYRTLIIINNAEKEEYIIIDKNKKINSIYCKFLPGERGKIKRLVEDVVRIMKENNDIENHYAFQEEGAENM